MTANRTGGTPHGGGGTPGMPGATPDNTNTGLDTGTGSTRPATPNVDGFGNKSDSGVTNDAKSAAAARDPDNETSTKNATGQKANAQGHNTSSIKRDGDEPA